MEDEEVLPTTDKTPTRSRKRKSAVEANKIMKDIAQRDSLLRRNNFVPPSERKRNSTAFAEQDMVADNEHFGMKINKKISAADFAAKIDPPQSSARKRIKVKTKKEPTLMGPSPSRSKNIKKSPVFERKRSNLYKSHKHSKESLKPRTPQQQRNRFTNLKIPVANKQQVGAGPLKVNERRTMAPHKYSLVGVFDDEEKALEVRKNLGFFFPFCTTYFPGGRDRIAKQMFMCKNGRKTNCLVRMVAIYPGFPISEYRAKRMEKKKPRELNSKKDKDKFRIFLSKDQHPFCCCNHPNFDPQAVEHPFRRTPTETKRQRRLSATSGQSASVPGKINNHQPLFPQQSTGGDAGLSSSDRETPHPPHLEANLEENEELNEDAAESGDGNDGEWIHIGNFPDEASGCIALGEKMISMSKFDQSHLPYISYACQRRGHQNKVCNYRIIFLRPGNDIEDFQDKGDRNSYAAFESTCGHMKHKKPVNKKEINNTVAVSPSKLNDEVSGEKEKEVEEEEELEDEDEDAEALLPLEVTQKLDYYIGKMEEAALVIPSDMREKVCQLIVRKWRSGEFDTQ